ncbi:MAG: twin-arginine translocase TatA/TatE family subunit [Planctomycetota bacterium]
MWNHVLNAQSPVFAFIGGPELWIPLGLLVLLFGGRKLPELARAMGSSINQFKKGLETEEETPKAIETDGGKPSDPQS